MSEALRIIADALDEWLFRMHGITSSCDHATEAQGIFDALTDADYRVMRVLHLDGMGAPIPPGETP